MEAKQVDNFINWIDKNQCLTVIFNFTKIVRIPRQQLMDLCDHQHFY